MQSRNNFFDFYINTSPRYWKFYLPLSFILSAALGWASSDECVQKLRERSAPNHPLTRSLAESLPPLPRLHEVELEKAPQAIPGVQDAVVVALLSEGKILLVQRGSEIGFGEWGIVGGKMEEGETLIESLTRETFEEVGIQSLLQRELVHIHYHFYEERIFRVFVLRAELNKDESPLIKEPDKILDLDWFPLDELPHPLFSELESYREKLR